MPVHVARPSIPCDKPLPLANVLEVQRLLFLLEAPEYCMRAFREHGVNGQDLVVLEEEDLDDSRFKFPRHVQRKVMRIPRAWRTYVSITGSSTNPVVSVDQYVQYYSKDRPAAVQTQLRAAFRMVDTNNNGLLTFEEFLVGFSLLEAALAEQQALPHAQRSQPQAEGELQPAEAEESQGGKAGGKGEGGGWFGW
ncbi:hypothetical protein GPECTOR_58g584 [Gonium pectorale]|uniref:EF-hand domain-containing protein n=1 Tax=Gonium pectorale TaxID=33097 RepID=A0A150G6H9_GONPE|nr:hypothetical protein GPECTOR_58g584 [Gonium pectorale]|eukprot:KXZ45135.1 hypothetical protein GPECTOR_58g584 [Gonium pectorale]